MKYRKNRWLEGTQQDCKTLGMMAAEAGRLAQGKKVNGAVPLGSIGGCSTAYLPYL